MTDLTKQEPSKLNSISTRRSLSQYVLDEIKHYFNYPALLARHIGNNKIKPLASLTKPQSISSEYLTRWEDWGRWGYPDHNHKVGYLRGWRYEKGYGYRSFNAVESIFSDLVDQECIERFTTEIQTVKGFSLSKSDLTAFQSPDEMVLQNSKEMINEITEAKLAKNLAHDQIRIISRKKTTDHFKVYDWDGRIFLSNAGGSHHFAAARYIARLLKKDVDLSAKLCRYSVNELAIRDLNNKYFIFGLDREGCPDFIDAMKALPATFLWNRLPRPLNKHYAIFLPKYDKSSHAVAKALSNHYFINIGNYLKYIQRTD